MAGKKDFEKSRLVRDLLSRRGVPKAQVRLIVRDVREGRIIKGALAKAIAFGLPCEVVVELDLLVRTPSLSQRMDTKDHFAKIKSDTAKFRAA